MAAELAIIFDLVRQHAPLVTFEGEVQAPAYDLYSGAGQLHGRAFALLEMHGLAHAEVWDGRHLLRLDLEARAALDAE